MSTLLLEVLAWAAAVGGGLMAGIYLAFSGFIMRSLSTLDVAGAIDAMNAINRIIVKSAFLPFFIVTTLVSLLLMVIGLWHWDAAGGGRAFVGGASYLFGMFGVTVFCNVPLNNRLAEVAGDGEPARRMWDEYRSQWTRWNSVRSVACVVSMVVSISLLSSS